MLTENDRLTHEHAAGWFSSPYSRGSHSRYWTNATKSALMERLGAYEDTGLSPQDLENILRKVNPSIGDRVEYQGTVYEIVDFRGNLVCLQPMNDDRHHEVDMVLFIFREDYWSLKSKLPE